MTDLTTSEQQVLTTLGTRPVSVRQLQDRLDKPTSGAKRWTRSQVRFRLESLTAMNLVSRTRGRVRWTVRYSLTDGGQARAARIVG